jgi:hypothetical protein
MNINLLILVFNLRRLVSLYDDSPNALVMCQSNNKEIKTEMTFDDDSNDSGFNEECKHHFFENLSITVSFNLFSVWHFHNCYSL